MSKIATRFRDVVLPQGDHDAALATLRREIAAEQAAEDATGGRFSSKSKAAAKAVAFDKLAAKAEAEAVTVRVYALSYDEFDPLEDLHPPRDGDAVDKRVGYDRKTFPHAVLKASLVDPEAVEGDTPEGRFRDLLAKGDAAFADLGRLSRLHYARLENEAWDVNVGDDSLPKFSAVSLLKAARGPDSKPQPDSE